MSDYLQLMNAIVEYERDYRHPELPEFEVGKWYDLFPERGDSDSMAGCRRPEKWPHNDRSGVYVFLDEHMDVLYIGKASMNNTLGLRLGTYVGYDAQGELQAQTRREG